MSNDSMISNINGCCGGNISVNSRSNGIVNRLSTSTNYTRNCSIEIRTADTGIRWVICATVYVVYGSRSVVCVIVNAICGFRGAECVRVIAICDVISFTGVRRRAAGFDTWSSRVIRSRAGA